MKTGWFSDWIVNMQDDNNYDEHIEERKSCYEKNRDAISKYVFWHHKDVLPEFDTLAIDVVKLGKNHYIYIDKINRFISGEFEITRTNAIQHPFFQDQSKPLLIKNEMNTYHWEYLNDNVRRSEDYGGDNHIYMYYENITDFIVFLQLEDVTPYLKSRKFVFLFGETDLTNKYPLDFRNIFQVDYDHMEMKDICINEIHRIAVNAHWQGGVGNDFFGGILDFHKDLLTIKNFGMSDFSILYDIYFKEKSVGEFETDFSLKRWQNDYIRKEIDYIFNSKIIDSQDDIPTPSINTFFRELKKIFNDDYIPTRNEWLKGIFLAYSKSMNRKFTGRIVPAIWFNTHFVYKYEYGPWKYNNEMFKEFKYYRLVGPLRYPLVSRASLLRTKNIKQKYLYLTGLLRLNSLFTNNMDYVLHRRYVRFEDLKLYPVATIKSVCEFFDIEWDDIVLKVTANGKEFAVHGTGGFDPAPVYRKHFLTLNPFDYYRLELLLGRYFKHWGYEPKYYINNDKYTNDEVIKLFEVHFKFEEEFMEERDSIREKAEGELNRSVFDLIKLRLNELGDVPMDSKGNKMMPIPWLKPKSEFVDGELYK